MVKNICSELFTLSRVWSMSVGVSWNMGKLERNSSCFLTLARTRARCCRARLELKGSSRRKVMAWARHVADV